VIIKCACGTVSRLPLMTGKKIGCPKCKHIFTPGELVKAQPEQRTPPSAFGNGIDELEIEDDLPFEDEEDEEW